MNLVFKNFTILKEHEHEKILKIRNLDYIRKQMKTDEIIELKNHLIWIESLKKDKKNLYFAVFYNGEIIGSIDITSIEEKSTSWGFYFKENTSPLVISFCIYLLIEKIFYGLNMEKITSEVKKTNKNAYKFNLSFGFLPIYEDGEYVFLELKKADWAKSNLHKLKKKIDKIDYRFTEKDKNAREDRKNHH